MKPAFFLSLLFFANSALANCGIYVHTLSNLKENERGLAIDLSSKVLRSKGYEVTPFLDKVDNVLKLALSPVLEERRFVYLVELELLGTDGSVTKYSAQSPWPGVAFKQAFEELPNCQ